MNYPRRCTDCAHSFSDSALGTQCTNPHVLADTPVYLSGDVDYAVAWVERSDGTVCGKGGDLFISRKKLENELKKGLIE